MDQDTAQDPKDGAQPANPANPGPATGDDQPGPSETVNWENRYKGVMTVLNQRNAEIERLKAEGQTAASTIESLNGQLGTLQAELDSKVAALTGQLKTITGERDRALTDNGGLNAYKIKMEALKEYPDLLPLADTIPDIPDAETMKQHLQLLAKGVNDITSQKASQLSAGLTPGAQTPAASQTKYAYSTLDDWQVALNNAAGGDEFAKLAAAYKQWIGKQ